MKSYSELLDHQYNITSAMAQIIGRYKGAMETYNDFLKMTLESKDLNYYDRSRLERIVEAMKNTVAQNEEAWNEIYRPKTKVENDIVELERA